MLWVYDEMCFSLILEFELMHVDEFIDELLHAERMCDIILPRLQVRLCPVSSHTRLDSSAYTSDVMCVCVCLTEETRPRGG